MFLDAIKKLNRTIGVWMQYLIMVMVFAQFLIVIVRYVFSTNSLMAQESIIYMFATSFMLAMAHTFMKGEHVYLDILFNNMTDRQKAWVYLLGSLLFFVPTMGTITYYTWDYVLKSWAVLEGGTETNSLPFVYILKTVLLIFCVQMLLHAVVLIVESYRFISGKTASYTVTQEQDAVHFLTDAQNAHPPHQKETGI